MLHLGHAAEDRTEVYDVVRPRVQRQAAQVVVHVVLLDTIAELPLFIRKWVADALPVSRASKTKCDRMSLQKGASSDASRRYTHPHIP